MVSLLYCAWNRLTFTEASFAALLANTDWDMVTALHVHDDGSADGTWDYLQGTVPLIGCGVRVEQGNGRGPVAATNRHLDLYPETPDHEVMVKIDNDFVVCPGWLPALLDAMSAEPQYDICGLGPCDESPALRADRRFIPATHIGGIGAFRLRAFATCRPTPQGRFGFTEWQGNHPGFSKGWLAPPLPCFNLDLVPAEPWLSLSAEYRERGWQREWPCYPPELAGLWQWWAAGQAAA